MAFLTKFFKGIVAILKFIKDYFKSLLFILIIFFLFFENSEALTEPNLAKVYLNGEIEEISELMEELRDVYTDDNIKGLLFIIDSPGGAVDKSIEISDMIKKIRQKKPVVVYAQGTLASGSYYSAIWSNKIITNRGSLIGSIGVIYSGFNLQKVMEKLGIETQIAKAGKFKETGIETREWLPYERKEIEKNVNNTYKMFISDVAQARHLDINKSDIFANAHIFTPFEAKKLGLIDDTGILIDAELELIKITKIYDPIWKEKDEDEFDNFIKSFANILIDNLKSEIGFKLK
jgi:protease-4